MRKDSEISRYAVRRTHRTYTREFKAELMATCEVPGAFIAAIAGAHAMNANVLHRWLKEHARSNCNGLSDRGTANQSRLALQQHGPAFIPVQLPTPDPEPTAQAIKVEVRKEASMAGVNYLGRPATTILAGGGGGVLDRQRGFSGLS